MANLKYQHFYLNKYVLSKFTKHGYFLSYNYYYKTLWFRIPKVASTSMKNHFAQNTPAGMDVYSAFEVGYIPSMFKNYTKFSFVREPMDRLLSGYKNKVLKANYFRFSEDEYRKMQDIDYFIDWLKDQDINRVEKHLRSQNSMIDLNNIDFLGRFENFEEDYRQLCELIGMPFDNLKTLNKSQKKQIELSPAQEKKVQRIYTKDYQIFYPTY